MKSRRRQCVSLTLAMVLLAGSIARADESKKPAETDFELYQVFADTLDQIERNYVKDISRRELIEAAIEGVLEKLDPYSNYISPEDINRFKSSVEQQFGGIGIQIGIENGQLKVISPLMGTPAYRAGLESGDAILEIDGKSTEGIQIDQAVKQLKGNADTKVTLTIRHSGSSDKETLTITREVIHVDTVLGDTRKSDDTWDFMLDPDKHVGYIRISAFSRDTAADVKKALEELEAQGLKGLILDLRFNPGGLLSSAIDVSDLFISDGKIVSTKGRNTAERTWDARKEGTFEGFPMVVLVNHYSASASEIVSAGLQDHHRAIVIGERTWGKGSVQNVIELEQGKSALKLTTAGYHRPSGKNIHRFPDAKEGDEWGVMPDHGYEVRLNGQQTARLMEYRRHRDILVGKHEKELASQSTAEDTSDAKPEDQAPPKEDQAPPKEDQTPPAKSDAPEPEADAAPADQPAGEADSQDDAAAKSEKAAKSDKFVDLQLQKAVDYLTSELAKAQ